jgi:hypothetical protein
MFSNLFFPENRARSEINWTTYGRARQATYDNTIQRMRYECWLSKATDTHSEYDTYWFSKTAEVTRTSLNITLYVRRLSCLYLHISRRCIL